MSESELLAMADVAVEDQAIETDERALIHSIIEFGDTIVREVMVPRTDMKVVESDQSVADVLSAAMDVGFSRLPVYGSNVDDVVGIAYAKDLIRAERAGQTDELVGAFVRPANFVPETKRVSGLMREMQALKYHLAIVVDEYGGTAGLVTLEDLIEELVGEIVDEYDVEEPPIEHLSGGEISVSSRLPVDELEDLVHTALPEGDWDSVGGLLTNVLGRIPIRRGVGRHRRAPDGGRAGSGEPHRACAHRPEARSGHNAEGSATETNGGAQASHDAVGDGPDNRAHARRD